MTELIANAPETLRTRLRSLGFKLNGHGNVLEKTFTESGTHYRLLGLVCNRDASLKIYSDKNDPVTIRFNRDYEKAGDFIAAYLPASNDS